MAKPHECPTCHGRHPAKKDCETCEGQGVVWEPEQTQESSKAHANGDLDLTYRRSE